MALFENPVLHRELLGNLRTHRAILLLAAYQVTLAIVVLIAWPTAEKLDLTQSPASAKKLANLFFLGQYVLASLMAPSFAAGSITGEKERKTYEMLLASPLRPSAIVIGKMIASMTHLIMLIIGSLPIIVLCLPLGGVSLYEVLAAYLGLTISVMVFGAIGIAWSSYFKRTMASLVVSYLTVLPLLIGGIVLWNTLENDGELRLKIAFTVFPAFGISAICLLIANAAARMLYPPDVGSEGEEVVDLEQEAVDAIGLVIQRDRFPDRLFAPPKKQALLPDGANPVYDKEIHSEIFAQGTLMLRLVIQLSMLLAIPLMAVLLFAQTQWCAWYPVYLLVFGMMVGPVFSAGSITSERERQTLDLLLTTTITPAQILWGKLIVALRVSGVLTSFLLWPLLLATLMVSQYWSNWLSLLLMLVVILVAIVVNSVVALLCSTLCRKTSTSLLLTYTILLLLYGVPSSLTLLSQIVPESIFSWDLISWTSILSPFAIVFSLPLDANLSRDGLQVVRDGNYQLFLGYLAFSVVLIASSLWVIRHRLSIRSKIDID